MAACVAARLAAFSRMSFFLSTSTQVSSLPQLTPRGHGRLSSIKEGLAYQMRTIKMVAKSKI
jgi:hypothetical protein